jgi:hypothetical protein
VVLIDDMTDLEDSMRQFLGLTDHDLIGDDSGDEGNRKNHVHC